MEYTIGSMVFGNWKIVNLIGQGSYGKVYEIQREDFGLTYKAALKVISIPQNEGEVTSLRQEGLTEDETTEYFYSMVQDIVNEFALMFRLKGMTNIVGYEDHVVLKKEDGIGWDVLIRMELLTPLFVYATEHPFTRRDVVKLGIDICKALELCKKYNIIHRDLKPENIFVSNNGDYKIGDFGIARTIEKTMSGLSKKGTYSYMAPEVYRGLDYGYTVDMYSLGIVLYRLLNQNRLPFMPAAPAPIKYSDREIALSRRVKGEMITTPFYHDKKLSEIVLKACAYNSKERYASPTEMREALEAINLDELDKQVIYPMGEEGTATSQVVEKKVSEVEEETVSMLGKEENTVSMIDEDESTVSMMDEEETVSMVDEEKPTGSSFIKDDKIVSRSTEKKETVERKTVEQETVKQKTEGNIQSISYKKLITSGVVYAAIAVLIRVICRVNDWSPVYYFWDRIGDMLPYGVITYYGWSIKSLNYYNPIWWFTFWDIAVILSILGGIYMASRKYSSRKKLVKWCGILNIPVFLIASAISSVRFLMSMYGYNIRFVDIFRYGNNHYIISICLWFLLLDIVTILFMLLFYKLLNRSKK